MTIVYDYCVYVCYLSLNLLHASDIWLEDTL